MRLPLTGGCVCGALRYEVIAVPLLLYACHCARCQRQSGSAFALSMPVAREAFHLAAGAPHVWRYDNPRGGESRSWFCAQCGGRTHGENTRRPHIVVVRAGTLDDTTWRVPVAHIWTENAQPWERFGDDALCYATQPDDPAAMRAAWKARLSAADP